MLKKVLQAFIRNKDNLNNYLLCSNLNLLIVVLKKSINYYLQESFKAGILKIVYGKSLPGSFNYLLILQMNKLKKVNASIQLL